MGQPAVARPTPWRVGRSVRSLGKTLVSAHESPQIRLFPVVRYHTNVEDVAGISVEWRIFRDVMLTKGLLNARNVEKPSDITHYLFGIR